MDNSTKFFFSMMGESVSNHRLVDMVRFTGLTRKQIAKIIAEDPESGITSIDTVITKLRDLADERKKPDSRVVKCLRKIVDK